MNISEFATQLNEFGQKREPFLFMVDFEMQRPQVWLLTDVNPDLLLYDINGIGNARNASVTTSLQPLRTSPISLAEYTVMFDIVMNHLYYGDSFLTNLTIRTPITSNLGLDDLFRLSKARYKLWMKNEFLVFSPEPFVSIQDNIVTSNPMKGTIAATEPNASKRILADQKELAEHVTIVDLIRNDLSIIASSVRVNRFRYIEELKTNTQHLLQVSSEITGKLLPAYQDKLGNALVSLLPAGSVSGAPKPKTTEVIARAEGMPRGYYTGVCGIFDGSRLDSGVMIRYIEETDGQLFYRSGGGITTQSLVHNEYLEALQKVYVPIN